MKYIVYTIIDSGVDGRAVQRITYSSLSESERDQKFDLLGKNKVYYFKGDKIVDLQDAGKSLIAKLDGIDRMLLELCLNSDLTYLGFQLGDQSVMVYKK